MRIKLEDEEKKTEDSLSLSVFDAVHYESGDVCLLLVIKGLSEQLFLLSLVIIKNIIYNN